jgi:hypothetical protein
MDATIYAILVDTRQRSDIYDCFSSTLLKRTHWQCIDPLHRDISMYPRCGRQSLITPPLGGLAVKHLQVLLARYHTKTGLSWCIGDWRRLSVPEIIDVDELDDSSTDATDDQETPDEVENDQRAGEDREQETERPLNPGSDRCDHLFCDIRYHRADWDWEDHAESEIEDEEFEVEDESDEEAHGRQGDGDVTSSEWRF